MAPCCRLPAKDKAKAGQTVVYGIRPEHLKLGEGQQGQGLVIEPTGPEIHIYADLGGQEVCAITRRAA